MGVVDKILLLILVLLLPLGLVTTYRLFPENDETALRQEELEKKLDGLMQQLSFTASEMGKEIKPIKLSQAVYASDSGVLKVSGSAPTGQAAVLISATVLPSPTGAVGQQGTPKADESVKGSKVELLSVQPDSTGLFTFEYPVGKVAEGVVELRFEQKESVETVRFDLKTKTQVF